MLSPIEEALAELLGTIIAMIIIFIIATYLIDRHFEKEAKKDRVKFQSRSTEITRLEQKLQEEMEKFNY